MDHATVAHGDQELRFRTDEWPERERLGAVRELLGRTILRFEFIALPDGPLQIETSCRALPGLGLADVTFSEASTRRSAQHLASDDLCFSINLSGTRTLTQRGREGLIEEGEAMLTSGAEVMATAIRASRFIAFGLPRKAIAGLVPDIDDRVARPIRRDCEAVGLLTGYAGMLRDAQALATPAAQHLAVSHVYDLIALALGATHDAAEIAKERGARAARLSAIKADIVANVSEDLTVTAVAARHRVPVRYLQRLFEEEGSSFTAYVLEQRLARARRTLINPRLARLKISAVAMDAGFCNLSYFNQTFRRRYGASPSDVRTQARRGN